MTLQQGDIDLLVTVAIWASAVAALAAVMYGLGYFRRDDDQE